MYATFNKDNTVDFSNENYRGYVISYERSTGTFYVSNDMGYRRGISSMRKDARRWVDLLLAGRVK